MDSKTKRELHERAALDLLTREGIAVIWRLHLKAATAYRDGHPLAAETLISTADAAERLLRYAGVGKQGSFSF